MIGIISLVATMVIAVVFINQYMSPGNFSEKELAEWKRKNLEPDEAWRRKTLRFDRSRPNVLGLDEARRRKELGLDCVESQAAPDQDNPRSLEFRVKDGFVRIELTGDFERLQRMMREFAGTPVEEGIRKYLADIVPRMLDEAAGQAKGYRG